MKKNNGLTLIELVAVLAVTAVIMATAAPGIMAALPRWRLKSAAVDLFANLQLARITAIRRGVRCRVTYSPGGYRLSLPGSGTLLKSVVLEHYGSGVRFKGPAPACRTFSSQRITFNPRGLSNAGYAYLSTPAGDVHYRVGPTTAGVIKLQKLAGRHWR